MSSSSWRQILWAKTQRVPEALGLSTREWVERLGGYVRMEIPERREAVKELAANGHSTRAIAEVIGVDQKTVVNDIHAEENSSESSQPGAQNKDPDSDAEENSSASPDEPPEDPELDAARENRRQQELERQRRVALARSQGFV